MSKYNSIDELDAALDAEFAKATEGDDDLLEEELQESDESSDIVEEEVESDDSEDDLLDDEDVEEVIQTQKQTKQEFAFGQLRHENSELKTKLAQAEKYSQEFNEMAATLGYSGADALIDEYRKQRMTKEAKQQGMDPEVYRRLKSMEEQLALAEREKQQAYRNQGLQKFDSALNSLLEEYNLGEEDKQSILDNMGGDGYTLEELATMKAPRKVIKGYISDKIAESMTQERLAKEKKARKLKEEKLDGSTQTEEDLDELIRKEMEAYAKENNLYK